MRSEEFVALLTHLAARDRESAIAAGVDEDEADEIAQGYIPKIRPAAAKASDPDDELLRLLALYDCSHVELPGAIRFHKCPRVMAQGTAVAAQEADPIVRGADGELRLHDHSNMDFVISRCASSGTAFMEAIACFATAMTDPTRGEEVYERVTTATVALAGGDEYRDFWSPLCAYLRGDEDA